jgi:hypothetical protein
MLLKNRAFTRIEPERSAQKIYVFCEGKDREYNYFRFFEGMDSRLNLIVYELQDNEDNSPKGLYELAQKCLVRSKTNPHPKYDDYRAEDTVWIVVDTDKDKRESRKNQLITIRERCTTIQNWNIAQSNPCFEVWLYYHQESEKPNFPDIEVSAEWKKFVGDVIKGGFNPRRHPILIQKAIGNSEKNFQFDQEGQPDIATTEVFNLAKSILSIGKVKETIEMDLQRLK